MVNSVEVFAIYCAGGNGDYLFSLTVAMPMHVIMDNNAHCLQFEANYKCTIELSN